MNNKKILVNCVNVKAAQQQIQDSKAKVRLRPESTFSLGLLPILENLEADGLFRRSHLARCLNERGIVTSAGKRWGPVTVDRLLAELADVIRMAG